MNKSQTQPVNLITPKTLSSFTLRKSKRIWSRLGIAAFIATTLGIVWFQYARSVSQRQVALIVNAADGPRKILRENKKLHQKIRELANTDSKQQAKRGKFPPLAVLDLLATVKRQLAGKLTVEQFDYTLDITNSTATNSVAKSNGKITLQLVTSDAIHSSAFIEQLSASGLFRDVQLNTAVMKASPEADDVRFGVACTF
ncbi:MAG TPA: hypothetical protein DDW52_16080 [Planctomycetaceae bacterium]|nr:hypothetical protein [Planctomycetaceae bacterium]